MDEIWRGVDDFDQYEVSNYGDVRRGLTGEHLARSQVTGGAVVVFLYSGGQRYTRSVKVLVAEAFVECPEESAYDRNFDTPILLDNDPHNLRADNIQWRPRSYALRYKRQFDIEWHSLPVVCVETDEVFETALDAAAHYGMLAESIINCANGALSQTFPHNYHFDFVTPL